MGKVITPKYRVELFDGKNSICAWRGKATDKRLVEYVASVNASMLPSGVNAHVSKALDYIPYISKAKIIEQKTGLVIAEYKAPLFQVF